MGFSLIRILSRPFMLLLPAVIPSWRFFDVIAPSPRIEFAKLDRETDEALIWQEFRPRPAHLPFTEMLKRMLSNPDWNESLFLVSCAERLMAHPTKHSADEIFNRIETELVKTEPQVAKKPFFQFRLVFLYRQREEVEAHIAYISEVRSLGQGRA